MTAPIHPAISQDSNAVSVESTALFAACEMLEEFTGSCPSDVKGWEHPDTCEKHCEIGCETECWRTFFLSANAHVDAPAHD